jgi:hypothetical protein
MSYEPEGPIETVGDAIGAVSSRVQSTVEQFKKFIEARGREPADGAARWTAVALGSSGR